MKIFEKTKIPLDSFEENKMGDARKVFFAASPSSAGL